MIKISSLLVVIDCSSLRNVYVFKLISIVLGGRTGRRHIRGRRRTAVEDESKLEFGSSCSNFLIAVVEVL